MQLQLKHNLPFASIFVENDNKRATLSSVLIDTGSASTLLSADILNEIGIFPEPNDPIITIRGIGGTEVVYRKVLQKIVVGEFSISNFAVEIGAMDYGFAINGIIGMDFLIKSKCVVDMCKMHLMFC